MRLKIYQARSKKHTSVVCAVGWTPANELFSVSDDRTIIKWGMDGEPENKPIVEQMDTYATDFRWYCSVRGGVLSADVFVVACCDGSFRIMSSTGRLEKSVPNAHTGAVTAVAWNFEGTALATAGEDGCVKQWSRSGNLRSKLATCDSAIYSVCWSPDNSSVLYCSGRFIMIKPLAVSAKQLKWRAHDGTVLKVDWNPVNNLIVSGGEDCKYKVWDSFGLLLFQSAPAEHVISSVSWCPNGNYFAVGSFNRIILCDKTGWSHSRSRTDSGSIQAIDWSADGTHLAGAGANGCVCFGQIVDRSVEWSHLEARLNEHNHVIVQDVGNEAGGVEDLEFGDGVIDMSLGYDHLIVATSKTCYIYHVTNLATPHIFELKGTVSLIMQAQKYFVLVDKLRGLLVYGYDGRSISNPRLAAGVHPQFLKRGNIAISSDAIAIIDRALPTQVHLIDIETGKPLCDPLRHDLEIIDISLSQSGLVSDRKLTFIDRNRDLHMHQCMTTTTGTYKLATMVDSCIWHDRVDMVCAISDSKLLVWYYPNMVYVDRDLVASTRSSRETTSLGKNVELVSFAESRVTVRRADGASQVLPISPYAQVLHRFAHSGEWSRAIRLCRVVRDSVLWSVLAGLSISAAELDTAEMSLAAIEEVDKLQYIQSIKAIPSQEGRTAELLLYRRQHDQAEQTLIQADLIYRAIQLNISIFRWARALDLAIRYKTHIDTVLGFRSKYLLSLERSENDERFLKLSQEVPCDWNSINIKIEQEIRKEEQRGTPYRTQTGFVPDLAAISIKYYSQQQQQQAAAAAAAAAATAASAPSFERKTDPTMEYGQSQHTFQPPPPQHMQSHPIIEQTNGTVTATHQHDDDLPF